MPVIVTNRLRLVSLTTNDTAALWETVGRGDAVTYSVTRKESPLGGWSIEATKALIEGITACRKNNGYGRWGVKEIRTEKLIGYCGFNRMDYLDMSPEVELSFRLHPDTWGQGYGPEAATAALDWAFSNLNVDSVVGCTMPANIQSVRALGKLGMVYETTLPYGSEELQVVEDFAVYRVTRGQWESRAEV